MLMLVKICRSKSASWICRTSGMSGTPEKSLRNATREFVIHYHSERNHQGLENKIIEPGSEVGQATGDVECRERLGGLLNYYHRRAA